MTPKRPPTPPTAQDRDHGMVRGMGWFFTVLAILVWMGQLWEQSEPERIVNAASGATLFFVGGLMIWRHWRTNGRRPPAP